MHAELDSGQYATSVTVSDAQMASLPITSHDWNYTLLPAWLTPATGSATAAPSPRRDGHAWLIHPTP
ncbi:hypothetical protein Aple_044220 [Acrocarpospora pleiomorpha]|uniref:Uncharacterized protein n=1 Tax=Acrocarpospora pleiomorpha TaxID=90975 RepID=A0A5M3XLB2_9ACTN|nr:hypothetical protein Aple_044220 [Acrocarpospora pleiomorpha]